MAQPQGMRRGFVAPLAALARKPPHGAPCNRCGLCCIAVLCPLAKAVFKRDETGPCPALEHDKATDTYACGLVMHPENYAPSRTVAVGAQTMSAAATWLVGVGDGCDARFNGEPRDAAFSEALDAEKARHESKTRAACAAWNVRGKLEWIR